jgi:hypothetical protein
MKQGFAFYPLSEPDKPGWVRVSADGESIDTLHLLNPMEHSTIYPYKINGCQKTVLGSVSYRQLYMNAGLLYAAPIYTVLDDPFDDACLFNLPIIPLSENFVLSACHRHEIRSYIYKSTFDLKSMSTSMLIMLGMVDVHEKIMANITRQLVDFVRYGSPGMLALLEHIGISDEILVTRTTAAEYFRLLRKYPHLEVPDVLFMVDPLDIPAHPDVPIDLSTRKCHVSHCELIDYLIFRCRQTYAMIRTRRFIYTRMGKMPNRIIDLIEERALPAPRSGAGRAGRSRGGVGKKKKTSTSTSTSASTVPDIEDIAEVTSMFPPCVSRLAGHDFPKNQERVLMVKIMRRGNVPLETVDAYFSHLFDAYPDSSFKSLEDRFNFEYVYNMNYKSPSCDKMECPLNKDKGKCHALFAEKHPNKVRASDGSYFFGPSSWFYWATRE